MKRCVIVGGAEILNYERVRGALRSGDFVIYCDCGLKHREGLGAEPGLIVGDFDSHERPDTDIETIELPCEKDDTDTVYAVKEAIGRGYTDFLLVGVVGQRFDHTMGNISILVMLANRGMTAEMIDDYSVISLIDGRSSGGGSGRVDDKWAFFSLLPIGGDASGVTIRDAKYEVEDVVMPMEFPYGVSNEPVPGKTAEINVESGMLLLIKVFDR